MYDREESEYFTAKRKAAKLFGLDHRYNPKDLPSNREIREHIQLLADLYEGDQRIKDLHDMRIDALRMMRQLRSFRPHLIGSVLTGHIRKGSDIDVHVFSDSVSAITDMLDCAGQRYDIEQKRVIKHNEERFFTHIHVHDRHTIELTVYTADKVNYPFKSSITGKTIERANIDQLESLLREHDPDIDLDAAVERLDDFVDVFELFRLLLLPLENVKQNRQYHPEGDALYHSLQVFELARAERPWDEEFILAALLHDVGKAIDPSDHVGAGIMALEGTITERTEFLIAHHMEAHAMRDGTLGKRAKRRLQKAGDDLNDLILLSELDKQGRQRGAMVCEVDEALEYLRQMNE